MSDARSRLSPEVRTLIVRQLGAALADAWRRQHVDRNDVRERDEGIGEEPTAVLITPSPAGV